MYFGRDSFCMSWFEMEVLLIAKLQRLFSPMGSGIQQVCLHKPESRVQLYATALGGFVLLHLHISTTECFCA